MKYQISKNLVGGTILHTVNEICILLSIKKTFFKKRGVHMDGQKLKENHDQNTFINRMESIEKMINDMRYEINNKMGKIENTLGNIERKFGSIERLVNEINEEASDLKIL
jgi:predicted  nucleic acid-binding Zn-ribbon protein